MDLLTLHRVIAYTFNTKHVPVIDKFIMEYEGEINYVFRKGYIIEVFQFKRSLR